MKTAVDQTGEWLQEMRERRGLSPEEVPQAMLRAKVNRRNIPSGRTIRRVEATGRMPEIRYAFGIATFYGVDLHQLWPVGQRAKVAA